MRTAPYGWNALGETDLDWVGEAAGATTTLAPRTIAAVAVDMIRGIGGMPVGVLRAAMLAAGCDAEDVTAVHGMILEVADVLVSGTDYVCIG